MNEQVRVTFEPHAHRFAAQLGNEVVGELTYRMDRDTMILVETRVDPEHEGRGIGSALAQFAFEMARESGDTKIRPQCPFVAAWVNKHPDYRDLLA
ncbi:GNAT family N-acetyltransferase [Actinomyces minihominis]|uniref:GNAT family N-acetyltransferase n=1 Tax=Actinomyces minihominis TaxID=2002838 RepID=UPI000C08AC75|nr:GNAT family N-acetyltransferase [Actinomyces minihominis]